MIKKWPPLELPVWIGALLLLALARPGEHHFSLCPLANMGISWCLGCGLGRAITYLFHGDLYHSWKQHWFAVPALGILVFRIIGLSRQFLLSLNQ
ncbi:MAG: DUF2752 domain-containing protein [Sphingobacteriaceae bacterium]